MIHYWGAQAIVQRIGLRNSDRISKLIRNTGLPAFYRRDPKRPCCKTYYSDEAMITAWLLQRARDHRQERVRKHAEKEASKANAQQEKEKSSRREAKRVG
jgi:hypothetical protein